VGEYDGNNGMGNNIGTGNNNGMGNNNNNNQNYQNQNQYGYQWRTLEVLFSGTAPTSGGWVGWGLNPQSPRQMIGTQAFIAFQATNGSTILTYDVTAATKGGAPLTCSPISYQVSDMQVQISRGNSILIYVRLELPPGSPTVLNHVWNRGNSVSNFRPSAHGFTRADLSTFATIEMAGPPGYQTSSSSFSATAAASIVSSFLLLLLTNLFLLITSCTIPAS
jgi:hypothetical protein